MTDEELKEGLEEEESDLEAEGADPTGEEGTPEKKAPHVSARDVARPATNLPVRTGGQVGNFKVSLAGDFTGYPSLTDVERANGTDQSEARTPLMTVILAILADRNDEVPLSDLAAEAVKLWNRSLPLSPYSAEEFLYMLLVNSDNILVRH